jgi:hypothetical protein
MFQALFFVTKSAIQFIIYHFIPYAFLLKTFKRYANLGGFSLTPTLSGRISLYKLLSFLKGTINNHVVLIPDYICNVVNIAIERAGYEPIIYSTDDNLEPDWDEIKQIIKSHNINILLTASIYGSSGLLDKFKLDEMRTFIIQHNIYVIVDICQDINLISKLPQNYGKYLSAIISFNDKSIPGAMGGMILSQFDIPDTEKILTKNQIFLLYKHLLGNYANVLKFKLFKRGKDLYEPQQKAILRKTYDYSKCTDFPYVIDNYQMAKIQLIMATIGIMNLSYYNKRQKSLLDNCDNYVRTVFCNTAPYLMISTDFLEGIEIDRNLKPPYAIHGDSSTSLRADLIIIHNKGFFDERFIHLY